MLKTLSALYEVLIGLSPDEVIGALVIGLVLAMACAGLCLLAQKKTANPYPVFCGLIFAISIASLAIGLGYSRKKTIGGPKPGGGPVVHSSHGPGGPPRPHPPGHDWLREADADRNGKLTPEEAARFVSEADPTDRGWIDIDKFEHSRRGRGGPPNAIVDPPRSGTPTADHGGH